MKKLLAFFFGLLILGLALAAAWHLQQSTPAPRHVSGTIETDETHVASRYGGRVASILAAEGNLLRSGQVILELEAPELEAQRAQAAALLEELVAGPRPEEAWPRPKAAMTCCGPASGRSGSPRPKRN
ncbi:MAG: biotin/lipoyl-binding protein [Chloroflexi bacterium]|nr:biotin/lipoyl-binding protein [Chloroflexota bacterium]